MLMAFKQLQNDFGYDSYQGKNKKRKKSCESLVMKAYGRSKLRKNL